MDTTTQTPAQSTAPARHPPGLSVLFGTEMWERFSYYGMRCLLIYYMTKQLLYAQAKASSIYGLYTACVYLTPFFGGIVADRWLGQRRAVIVGCVIMALGEFMLMSQGLFVPALVMIIIGNGFFKPNIATQVGNLYAPGDHRRDRAFSVFYVGVNVGATISPLVAGTLGERYAFKWGFCAAGVGMLIGLVIYLWGQRHLAPDRLMQRAAATAVAADEPLTSDEWKRIGALAVICLLNIVFWGVYEQQGNTLALWVDVNTDRIICGWEMPATWYQFFNALMIVIFTPAILAFWRWQEKRGQEPSSVAKMAFGCICLGLSFLMLLPQARVVAAGGKATLLSLTLSTAVLTVGELYLSPVGLSLVTKLAPPRMVSMLMGLWFISNFMGNYLCGYVGTFWEKIPHGTFFGMLAALACAAGGGMFLLLRPLKTALGQAGAAAVDV